MIVANGWAPSWACSTRGLSPLVGFFICAGILAIASVDWASCSWAENLIILAIFRAMYRAYVTVKISVFFNTQIGVFAASVVYSSWAINMIGWTDGWAIRGLWTIFIVAVGGPIVTFRLLLAAKGSISCRAENSTRWTCFWASMGVRLLRTALTISIFGAYDTNILCLASLMHVSVIIDLPSAQNPSILTLNGASSRAKTIWGVFISLFWYTYVGFFASINRFSFTQLIFN